MAGRPKRRARQAKVHHQKPVVSPPVEEVVQAEGVAGLHVVPPPKASVQRANRMWKPFTLGNTAALKSGAYSTRVVDPAARDHAEWLAGQEDLPFLGGSSFAPSVMTWAQRRSRADLLNNALSEHFEESGCVGCTVCVSLEDRWLRAVAAVERSEQRLGLDPQARAEILLRLQMAKVIELPDESTEMKSMLTGVQQQLRAYAEGEQGDG